MATVNIGRKFELDNDTGNNRLIVRALDTGNEWYFNEDGTISNIDDPSSAQDAVNKQYADTTFFDVSGDTVSGNIQMDNNGITNLTDPTNPKDAANKTYVDTTFVDVAGDTMSGNLDMASNSIVSLADPSNAQDAATKAYADSIAQSLDIKESVDVASTANIDLTSSSDPGAIDGVTLSDGDRILLKDQTTASENGVYVATTAADPSSWARASDVDEDNEVDAGMFIFVEEGSAHGDNGFVLVSDDPLVVGTDDLQFTQFSGAGQITAGNQLTKTGDTLDVDDGPGSGLDADTVDGIEASALGSDVSNDGSTVTSSATDLDFTTNLTASDDGDGTSTIAIDDGPGSGLDADTVDGIEATDLGFKFDGQVVSSNHTASQGENVFVDASSSAVTVTLPSPSTDLIVNVKKIDSSSNNVTVSPNSTETIDDQANIIISSEYASLTFASDGTDYYII